MTNTLRARPAHTTVWGPEVWQPLRDAHQERVDGLIAERRWRADRGIAHPVEDFLWEYYTLRPSQLRRWHPGAGIILTGTDEELEQFRALADYRPLAVDGQQGLTLDLDRLMAKRGTTLRRTYELLRATDTRPGRYDCFGMHEWAMVYRQEIHRHRLPLRLGQAATDALLEQMGARCTHFDAFRFFTPPARARNEQILTRDDQLTAEQPGCLHANMDLYRAAYKVSPLIGSELLADCFVLARDIRILDMAASPYDCSAYGVAPIAVETAAGRAAYVAAQKTFAQRSVPLRGQLIAELAPYVAAEHA